MNSGKRYSDAEVHAIFKRAALRQEEATQAEDASRSGLSLEELQEIGAEAGIDPAHIALAASELAVRGPVALRKPEKAFAGIPTRLGASRRIRSTISDESWEQVVFELREIFGRDGIAGGLGKTKEWTVMSSMGNADRPVKVSVQPDGEGSLITINQDMKGQAIGLSIGAGTQLAMGVILLLVSMFSTSPDSPPMGVGLMFLGLAALFYGGTLVGTRMYAKRQLAKFERALNRIEQIGQNFEGMAASQNDRLPHIDLNALPEADRTSASEPRARLRERE